MMSPKSEQKSASNPKAALHGATLVIAVALLAYVLSLFEFFQALEFNLYDLQFQIRGSAQPDSTDIAIVALDQPTSDSLSFPFDRRYYAEAIEKLNALGARLIVFDILFDSQGSMPESDSLFYSAIESAGNVVLCGNITLLHHPGVREPISTLTRPYPTILPPNAIWGLVNDFHDGDGVVRRYPIYLTDKDSVYLSLGLKTYGYLEGISKGEIVRRSERLTTFAGLDVPHSVDANTTFLNYYGPAQTFPTYSFIDVIKGDYDFAALAATLTEEEKQVLAAAGVDVLAKNPFEGKIVLIGASAENLQDNKYTPYFSSRDPRKTPGVEVHANALQMLFDRSFITPVNLWFIIFGVALLSFLTWASGERIKQIWGVAVAMMLIVVVMGGSYYLFTVERLWIRQMPLLLAVILGYPTNLLYHFIQAQREKAMIRGMFSQYVPKTYVQQLIQHPELLKLGGERRRMTMLFTDVAGFSTVSERLTPEELVQLLNEYLTAMSRVVFENDGIVDKYEGDLVMAEFGAPIWNPNHAAQGCRTGLVMQQRLAELRKKWKAEGRIELYSRVGINTGEVIVGNMGSEEKFDYTVMGDAVNLASRLEGANKEYSTTVMIGQNTWEDVKDKFVTRYLDLLRVVGKLEPVAVYELVAEKRDEVPEAKLQAIAQYEEGMKLYKERRFAEADALFRQALDVDPSDGPSKVYHNRSQLYIAQPPAADWDGVWTMQHK